MDCYYQELWSATASHVLVPSQGTVVVDETGGWLHSWWEQCQQLGVDHLRTPITLHPHPAPLELRDFAEKQKCHQVRPWGVFPATVNTRAALPSTSFCCNHALLHNQGAAVVNKHAATAPIHNICAF